MIIRWLVSFLVAAALIGSLLELSSVAAERRTEPRAEPDTCNGLFVDVLTPKLPVTSEIEGPVPTRPGLTL